MSTKRKLLFITTSTCLIIFTVFNNMGGSMMSYAMPRFPLWLLYGTTILYTIGFWVIAFMLGDNPLKSYHLTWKYQRHYIKLAILTSLAGIFFQFSAAWVDGAVSQVLQNLVVFQVPIIEVILIKDRKKDRNRRWWMSLIIIFIGIGIGTIPAFEAIANGNLNTDDPIEQSNKWYWILGFSISTTFYALEQVAQDQAFHDKEVNIGEFSCLAWYNLYSVPIYILSIPIGMIKILNGTTESMPFSKVWENQINAFVCFFTSLITNDCKNGSTFWPIIFVIGYIGASGTNAYLINNYGVLFPNIISPTGELLSALFFMIPPITNEYSTEFSIWPLLGCALTVIGILIKGTPKSKRKIAEDIILQEDIELQN